MSISDIVYRPFENLIRPLDIPYRPLPPTGPVAVLLHFISMFRGVLMLLAFSAMAMEAINLSIVWGLSVIVDGVTRQGASVFLADEWPLVTFLGLLIFPAMPIASFLLNTLQSHTLGIGMPAAIQWQGHKAVEGQDLAFFHELFAGQVASRLQQVSSAVQQQIIAAFIADLAKGMWIGLARKPQWRCLIPVAGFAEAEGEKGRMTRTWLALRDQSVFAWAGLWRISDGLGTVYSGVMTDADEAIQPVHEHWLHGSFDDALA